jgi:hypothetical protein
VSWGAIQMAKRRSAMATLRGKATGIMRGLR